MIRDREGDHSGRFTLPDGREAYGTVSLAPNTPPRASLHPDTPTPIGPEGRGFPQQTRVDQLIGHLYSNEEVILGDVHLTEWFPDQFSASARWALIGLDATRTPDGLWNSVQVRATGIESLLGNAIASTSWPKSMDRSLDSPPLRLSADLNPEAKYVSDVDGVTVTAQYDPTFTAADPYRFEVNNYATVELESATPLSVDAWLRDWINPLVGVIALATGEREEINTVFMSAPDPNRREASPIPARLKGQLFGAGVHQRDQIAERRPRRDGTPLIPVFTLEQAPPLAVMIRTWLEQLADQAASALYNLALDTSLPPSVRFLLCVQAVEALDSSDNAVDERKDDDVHREQRKSALRAINQIAEENLDPLTKRFATENLMRRPHRPLSGRLQRIASALPDHQSTVADWLKKTDTLGRFLESQNRTSHPLQERLASTRNALSHGDSIPASALTPAIHILETLLRGQLLGRLGFAGEHLETAYQRMTRHR